MDQSTPRPSRRRWTISVRMFLLLILAVGFPLGWWVRQARLQARAVAAIEAAFGSVVYDDDAIQQIRAANRLARLAGNKAQAGAVRVGQAAVLPSSSPLVAAPGWKLWLVRTWGIDFVANVTQVTARGKGPGRELDLALLADLPHLEHLNLRHKPVGDAGLRLVAGLRQLRVLLLEDTGIDDAGLVHLAPLSALEQLGLTNNSARITDEGLGHLQPLWSLRNLWVGGPAITDAGLRHLHALPNLKEFDLVGSPRVTEAGVAELRRRFPDLRCTRR